MQAGAGFKHSQVFEVDSPTILLGINALAFTVRYPVAADKAAGRLRVAEIVASAQEKHAHMAATRVDALLSDEAPKYPEWGEVARNTLHTVQLIYCLHTHHSLLFPSSEGHADAHDLPSSASSRAVTVLYCCSLQDFEDSSAPAATGE